MIREESIAKGTNWNHLAVTMICWSDRSMHLRVSKDGDTQFCSSGDNVLLVSFIGPGANLNLSSGNRVNLTIQLSNKSIDKSKSITHSVSLSERICVTFRKTDVGELALVEKNNHVLHDFLNWNPGVNASRLKKVHLLDGSQRLFNIIYAGPQIFQSVRKKSRPERWCIYCYC